MAGYASTYLANEWLDHTLNNASYTSPTTVYLALYTDNPTKADTGTEVTGGSYARKSVSFGTASAGATDNTAGITFADMPNSVVTHWGIKDALTSGNLLYYGPLNLSSTLNSGDDFVVELGDLDISIKQE